MESEPASQRFIEVATRSGTELDAVFAAGTAPDIGALADYEYRGWNVPATLALLGIRKFIKAFGRTDAETMLGCNTPVSPKGGLRGQWRAKPSEDRPKRYAFFLVEPADPEADGDRAHAALLDYGRGGNRGWDPSRVLRDYLVRVEPSSDDLLLGKGYVVVARRRLWHSYFVLERLGPLRGTLPARMTARANS